MYVVCCRLSQVSGTFYYASVAEIVSSFFETLGPDLSAVGPS
jgi:hypothetical protein